MSLPKRPPVYAVHGGGDPVLADTRFLYATDQYPASMFAQADVHKCDPAAELTTTEDKE